MARMRVFSMLAFTGLLFGAHIGSAAEPLESRFGRPRLSFPPIWPATRSRTQCSSSAAIPGRAGPVYPYPIYDTLTGKKVDKTYTIVYLENEYVRIGVLPESAARIFEGVDKTDGYNFIYRQHVIKPALIGLMALDFRRHGMEHPHHHRASTFLPVQYKVEENADGSKTDLGRRVGSAPADAWAVGYTLRPGKPISKPKCAFSIARLKLTPCSASPTWQSMPTRTTR